MNSHKEIQVHGGNVALVDDVDYEMLSRYKWYLMPNGYVFRSQWRKNKQSSVYMHRQIMQPDIGLTVDHINHNQLDNRRVNLRVCSQSQNHMNRRNLKKNATSIYKGVYFSKILKKWRASLKLNRNNETIGWFDKETKARDAYDFAASCLHGEFACTNEPVEPSPNHGLTIEQVKLGAKMFAETTHVLDQMYPDTK